MGYLMLCASESSEMSQIENVEEQELQNLVKDQISISKETETHPKD